MIPIDSGHQGLMPPLLHKSTYQDLAAQQLRLGQVLPHRLTRWCEEGSLPYLQAWLLLPAEVKIPLLCLFATSQSTPTIHNPVHTHTYAAPHAALAAGRAKLFLPDHGPTPAHARRHVPQQRALGGRAAAGPGQWCERSYAWCENEKRNLPSSIHAIHTST